MSENSLFAAAKKTYVQDNTHTRHDGISAHLEGRAEANHSPNTLWQDLTKDLIKDAKSHSPAPSAQHKDAKLEDLLKKWNQDPEMMDPGFSGGVDAIKERRQQEGTFLRSILHGNSYADARKAAGMPRDVDPGMGGGEAKLRDHAMQEAKLLQGITNGMGYQAARVAAGMGRDTDPGMGGGEKQMEKDLRAKAARLGFKPE